MSALSTEGLQELQLRVTLPTPCTCRNSSKQVILLQSAPPRRGASVCTKSICLLGLGNMGPIQVSCCVWSHPRPCSAARSLGKGKVSHPLGTTSAHALAIDCQSV